MSKILLIDADVICYQFAFKNQKAIDWNGDGVLSIVTFEDTVLDEINKFISDMQKRTKCDTSMIILSDNNHNFRLDILPSYKENRSGKEKPLLWKMIREYLEFGDHGYPVDLQPTLEGDDLLGIIATHPETKDNVVVATIDKDLRTVPCQLHLFNKPQLGVMPIDPLYAAKYHLKQVLTGDTVDNYKGLKGVGQKGADKLLDPIDDVVEMWNAVVNLYESKGFTEADALVQARCAYILQHQDYNYETGEIKPWTILTALRNFKRSQ